MIRMAESNFAFEEYKILHAELHGHVQETVALEKFAGAAVAAVFSWLVAQKTATTLPGGWIWFLPVLLPLFGGLRCLALYKHIGLIATYLAELEKELGTDRSPDRGWEQFLNRRRRPVRGAIAWIIWVVLLVATEAFALSQVHLARRTSLVIVGTTGAICILGILAVWFGYRDTAFNSEQPNQ